MEIKKKKRVLLVDEASDWLQIWMALDVKGKAIKKKFVFLANRLVFPNTVTYNRITSTHLKSATEDIRAV